MEIKEAIAFILLIILVIFIVLKYGPDDI